MAGDATDRVPPRPNVDGASFDDDDRAGVHRLEHLFWLPLFRSLRLGPPDVHVLLEVALAVEERYADDGRGQVGGGAERIAGKNAEATAICWDRLLEADLHGEVGNGRIRRSSGHESRFRWARSCWDRSRSGANRRLSDE